MKIVMWIFYAALAIAVVALAVANRGPVDVSLAPLPYALSTRLFFVGLFGVAVGILMIGPGAAWRRWRLRRELKKSRADIAGLEAALRDVTAERDRYKSMSVARDLAIDRAQAPDAKAKVIEGAATLASPAPERLSEDKK